jgi:hypothetical protein
MIVANTELITEMSRAAAQADVPERVRHLLMQAVSEILRLRQLAGAVSDGPDLAALKTSLAEGPKSA